MGMAHALDVIDEYHAETHRHVEGLHGLCSVQSGDTCHLGAVLMEVAALIEQELDKHLKDHP